MAAQDPHGLVVRWLTDGKTAPASPKASPKAPGTGGPIAPPKGGRGAPTIH